MRILVAAAILAAMPSPARAEWFEAQSDHFVVYANDSESDVRKFSEILERYHAAIGFITRYQVEKPSPSNRLTIYVVGEQRVKQLTGGSDTIAGFYVPRAGGSVAFVPNIRFAGRETDFSLIVLLHEYAHHYMISGSRTQLPTWLNEGVAEFFASSSFGPDGTVEIGMPAYHRSAELSFAADVSVEQLVDPDLYAKKRSKGYDAFYGRAWALYHYLYFEPGRTGQIGTYLNGMRSGLSSRQAAEKAFGDLKQLDKNLDSYLQRRSVKSFRLPAEKIPIGNVSVARVGEGMGTILPSIAESKRGVNREQAALLLAKFRTAAERFPKDAAVLAALAEAEHDAGNLPESIAAADRAIAIDPKQLNAYVQKGYSLFKQAADAKDSERAYKAAMAPFSALNRLEPDHPLPLMYYYQSFMERSLPPPEGARAALERAAVLAPFDKSLTLNAGLMLAREGKIALATQFIEPLAFDPHGGRGAARARALVDILKTMPEGAPANTDKLMAALKEVQVDTADKGEESKTLR